MTKLRLAPDLSLPDDAVTQRLAFVGRPGSGKSYMATKLAELLFDVGAQFVALDPVGIWYGVRADGKGKGINVPVFGGLHGDVPLEPTAGAFIADLIVDRGLSCVLDVSQFATDADKARFAAAFAERFYFRKKAAPSAVLLFLEECQEFVPQNPQRGEEHMLHHFTRMAKLGRNFGIGIALITQRPQEVNKKVLNLTECLFAFQMTGVHERKAIRDWVSSKGADEDIVAVLPTLKVGVAHVYSPQWLDVSMQVKAYEKRSADVSSTPTLGAAARAESKPLAPSELAALTAAMAATIEKAKQEDPKELRREIADLRRQLAQAAKAGSARTVEKPVADPRAIERAAAETKRALAPTITQLRKALEAAMKFIVTISTANFDVAGVDKAELEKAITAAVGRATQVIDQRLDARGRQIDKLREDAKKLLAALKAVADAPQDVTVSVDVVKNEPFTVRAERSGTAGGSGAVRRPAPERDLPAGDGTISGVQQKILDTIAGMMQLGVHEPDKATVAALCGYHPNAKSYANGMGALRTAGLVHYPEGGKVTLTTDGQAQARAGLPVNTLDELHRMWYDKLGAVAAKILAPVIEVYPNAIDADVLAHRAGYHPNAKSFANMKGRLRTLGLIDYPRSGKVIATAVLFPEGL